MEILYTPSVCKQVDDQAPTFKGEIKVKVPNFEERYQFIEDAGLDVGDDGGIQKRGGNFAIIRNMVKASEKFYVSIDLTRISDDKKFNSFQDLTMDSTCDEILIEVAKEIRSGFRPSPK